MESLVCGEENDEEPDYDKTDSHSTLEPYENSERIPDESGKITNDNEESNKHNLPIRHEEDNRSQRFMPSFTMTENEKPFLALFGGRRRRVTRIAAQFGNIEPDKLPYISTDSSVAHKEEINENALTSLCIDSTSDLQPLISSDTEAFEANELPSAQHRNGAIARKGGRGRSSNRDQIYTGEQFGQQKTLPYTDYTPIQDSAYDFENDYVTQKQDRDLYHGNGRGSPYEQDSHHISQLQYNGQLDQDFRKTSRDYRRGEGSGSELEELYEAEYYDEDMIGSPEQRLSVNYAKWQGERADGRECYEHYNDYDFEEGACGWDDSKATGTTYHEHNLRDDIQSEAESVTTFHEAMKIRRNYPETEIVPSKIEVYGFSPSTDEEVLTMYFESTRKSGGGLIEQITMNTTKKNATISFKDSSVLDRVLKRSHVLAGCTLTVIEAKVESPGSETRETRPQGSSETAIEVSGFRSDTSEETLSMYFESTRKSGGSDVKELQMNSAKTRATIKFEDPAVIDGVLKRKHTLEGATLTVTKKTETETGENETIETKQQEEPERVLEVSGFRSDTSQDTLCMYFECTRKSGGGEIAELRMNTAKTQASVTFVNQSVMDQILQKTHILEGATLTVVEKKVHASRPIDSHRFFIRGLPEDIQRETLMLYIENRTNIPDDPDIVYGEETGTAMIYYAQEIPEPDEIIQRFSRKKLKGTTVKAERVQITNCILVQGILPSTPKDMLELYFENQRKSGGGSVIDVEFHEEENIAVVSFADWSTVNKVIDRTHRLSGQDLTVTAHYECLGTTTSTEGPVPKIPKPTTHTADPLVMEYIMAKHSSKLEDEMKECNTDVIWPYSNDNSQVLLKPSPIANDDRAVWRQWKNTSSNKFTNFVQKYVTEIIQVPAAIWADLYEILPEIEVGDVEVRAKIDQSTVTLVGLEPVVQAAKTTVLEKITDLKIKTEREAKTIERKLTLLPLKMKLFVTFAISSELGVDFPEVHITVCTEKNEVAFKGIRGEISEAQVAMYSTFEALNKCIFKTDSNTYEFMKNFSDKVNDVLSRNGYISLCDVDEGKVTIYGRTQSDAQNSMGVLTTEISSTKLPVEKETTLAVLQSKKGSDKINDIKEKEVVIIRIDLEKHEVRVTGLKDNVETAMDKIQQFLDENVVIEVLVHFLPLHSRFIIGYSSKELSEIQSKSTGVSIIPNQGGFVVKGNEKGASSVAIMLENLKAKLIERKHKVVKPGMPDLLRDQKGQRFLQAVERSCKCVIETCDRLDKVKSESSSYIPPAKNSEILCHYTTAEGCRLLVCKGDLTQENVDAIVNAANTDLQHTEGLAKAIVVAGGNIIQQECNRIIKQRGGRLNTSEAVRSGAGILRFRHVIHVSGPMWPKTRLLDKSPVGASPEENLLFDAVFNSLREAHVRKLKSIAIPAISSGVHGFPLKLCAKTIVEASVDFIKKNQTNLREIRFTNITVQHSVAFQNELLSLFGRGVVEGPPNTAKEPAKDVLLDVLHSSPKAAYGKKDAAPMLKLPPSVNNIRTDELTTKEGKKITLKKGNITSEKQVDVIVNTTAGEMHLSRGNVSKALLQAAGPGLQKECDTQVIQSDGTRRNVVAGDFIETGPGNLRCKKVYHSNCPGPSQTDAAKILQSMIKKLLLQASKSRMTSIAIPAIGTGNLGFPRDVVARVMYEGVAQFSKDNPKSTLKDIRFWVYDKDLPTIQAFETEMQRWKTPITAIASVVPKKEMQSRRQMKKSEIATLLPAEEDTPVHAIAEETYKEQFHGAYGDSLKTKLGSLTVQLQHGDLAKENTDAIVNTAGKKLALKGILSRTLIKAGGAVIADECDKIRAASSDIPHIAKTTAGNLPSKHIIHVTLSRPEKAKKRTRDILQLAEQEAFRSIAFPALGTGEMGGSARHVAPEMIDAIAEFAAIDKPKNLRLVKLVIFQQNMLQVFEETLKTKAGIPFTKPVETSWKRGFGNAIRKLRWGNEQKQSSEDRKKAVTSLNEEKDSLTLALIASEDCKLDEAIKQIEDFIQEEFHSEELIPDTEVAELSESVLRSVTDIGSKHKVRVSSLPGSKGVLLEGAKVSVLSTKADILALFSRMQAEEKRRTEDVLISKQIQWRYQTDTGIFDDYERDINGIIERAYQEKKPFVDMDMETEGTIRIDLTKMVEIDINRSRSDLKLHRVDLRAESSSSVPSSWVPMTVVENLKVERLGSGSIEYNRVDTAIRARGFAPASIVKIERIQNKELFTQYTARKESMKARLGRDTECTLYHGTSHDTVDKINMRGFNRSFCGKNAVAFGQGTYFARDIRYSAKDRYSPRDTKNQKYIYMCKVLVGDCEVGDRTIIVPHQKPNSPDIYDSTVDKVQNPSIVVIYHDAQAYPEYLVTFT